MFLSFLLCGGGIWPRPVCMIGHSIIALYQGECCLQCVPENESIVDACSVKVAYVNVLYNTSEFAIPASQTRVTISQCVGMFIIPICGNMRTN